MEPTAVTVPAELHFFVALHDSFSESLVCWSAPSDRYLVSTLLHPAFKLILCRMYNKGLKYISRTRFPCKALCMYKYYIQFVNRNDGYHHGLFSGGLNVPISEVVKRSEGCLSSCRQTKHASGACLEGPHPTIIFVHISYDPSAETAPTLHGIYEHCPLYCRCPVAKVSRFIRKV